MPEPNETTQNPSPKQEICSIRIMFQVESDEQAIVIKKKIADILADTSDVAINFSLVAGRPSPQ